MSQLVNAISFVTLSMPYALYRILTWSFTIKLTFTSLLFILAVILAVVYFVVRKKYLTQYSYLEPVEATKPTLSTFGLHSDTSDEHPDAFLATFLSSTKLFGYLEQPVFHEISRHVQIRNLPEGDYLFDGVSREQEESSFYFVVRGNVEVYIRPSKGENESERAEETEEEQEDDNDTKLRNCTLINQVGPGDNVSSLFTILAAFCECHDRSVEKARRKLIKRRRKQQYQTSIMTQSRRTSRSDSSTISSNSGRGSGTLYSSPTDESSLSPSPRNWSPVLPCFDDDDDDSISNPEINRIVPNSVFTEDPISMADNMDSKDTIHDTNKPITTTTNINNYTATLNSATHANNSYIPVQPNIIARASQDTILAVIPKEAFFNIYHDFPKSASKMIRVILSRFQKVSMMASRHYFGLTEQMFRMEYHLNNDMASLQCLPADFFKDQDGLNRLRRRNNNDGVPLQRSATVSEREVEEENKDGLSVLQQQQQQQQSHISVEEDAYMRRSLAQCFTACLGVDTAAGTNRHPLSIVYNNDTSSNNGQSVEEIMEDICILSFKKGSVLIEEEHKCDGVFFVVDGQLEALATQHENQKDGLSKNQHREPEYLNVDGHNNVAYRSPYGRPPPSRDGQQKHSSKKEEPKRVVFTIRQGQTVGYLSSLTGHASTFEVRAKTDCFVGYLNTKRLIACPAVMIELAKRMMHITKPLLFHIDISLEWMQVSAGHIICREGDPVNSTFMVLHGRLRAIAKEDENDSVGVQVFGEYGRGDGIGELEVLTSSSSPWTLHAIRDSEVVRIPKTLFNALLLRYPQVTLRVSRLVASRSLQLMASGEIARVNAQRQRQKIIHLTGASSAYTNIHRDVIPELYGRNNTNMRTVGIIPLHSSVPIAAFAEHLRAALVESVGVQCVVLNHAMATAAMGKYAFSRLGQYRLATWLAELEEEDQIVLYVADSGERSSWMRTCIRQADCIFLVGEAEGDSSVGEYERVLIDVKTTARKELVLLHPERSCVSGLTKSWLKDRMWIQAHHHVLMPKNTNSTVTATSGWLEEMTTNSINLYNQIKDRVPFLWHLQQRSSNTSRDEAYHCAINQTKSDFARLGRRLCGTSVALVLGGGGGARGIGHAGMIRALEEVGIPIDIIGGTGIGSLVSGCYAKNMNLLETTARLKAYARRMNSQWRHLFDLTYPLVAKYTGYALNRAIWKCVGDSQIEDFWLPFFAVTTNITYSRMEVHTSGYAWRYIRASMSLSGQAPPLVDHGSMLMDGSYIDNLPATVAKSMGADIVIAVDVAPADTNQQQKKPVNYYGDSLNGWYALTHNHLNPFRSFSIPTMDQVQSRLATVLSVTRLQQAKTTEGTLYTELPMQHFESTRFGQFDTIYNTSYNVARCIVAQWEKDGCASGRVSQSKHTHHRQDKGKEILHYMDEFSSQYHRRRNSI